MQQLITIYLVRLLNPLIGQWLTGKSKEISEVSPEEPMVRKFPGSFEFFYILMMMAMIIGLVLASIWLLSATELLFGTKEFPNEFWSFLVFITALFGIIGWLVTLVFWLGYVFGSGDFRDYLTSIQVKSGWNLSIEKGLKIDLIFSIVVTIFAITAAIIGRLFFY